MNNGWEKQVKQILAVTIEMKLNFDIHIASMCFKAYKIT